MDNPSVNPSPDIGCALTIELLDGATGGSLPGLIRIEDPRGATVPLEGLLSRGDGLDPALPIHRWSVLPGRATIRVPRAKLVVSAVHGLDTRVSVVELDLTERDRADVSVALSRFTDLRGRGLYSANTHLHLMKLSLDRAARQLTEIPAADGLDVVFVSYLERPGEDRDYVSNQYTAADLRILQTKSGVLFGNGEEHRHNFGPYGEGYGHVMLLNIPHLYAPVSIGPGITNAGLDGIPLRRAIHAARRDGSTVVWCHNFSGLENIANWIAGGPHALNIFDGAPESLGSYDEVFYRFLSAGLRVPLSTGTDWFIYDLSRVYVVLDAAPTGARDWLRALEAGRSFITNGPLLEFLVDDCGPGASVRLTEPGTVRVVAHAKSRVDFGRVEVVRNGRVVCHSASRAEDGYFAADITGDIDVAEPCWLALRVPPADPSSGMRSPSSDFGLPLFAHTSAVYVQIGDRLVFDAAVAAGLLGDVKRKRDEVLDKASFRDVGDRAAVVAVYEEGIAALNRLLGR
jgi:hypothetical protein